MEDEWESLPLEEWRDKMDEVIKGSDPYLSARALLSLTFNDPDRSRVEKILLECFSDGSSKSIKDLSLVCMGHVGRIHEEVSSDIVAKLVELLDDENFHGIAEDALGDISSFCSQILPHRGLFVTCNLAL